MTIAQFNSVYKIAENNYKDYILLNNNFKNTKEYNFSFDNLDSSFNMNFFEFISRIKQTYEKNIY